LRRAGLILLTRCDQVPADQRERLRRCVSRHAPGVGIVETVHQPVEWVNSEGQAAQLELARERPVVAFCGIGNPEAFRQTLTGLGAAPTSFRVFPDHHAYTRSDVQELHRWAREQPSEGVILTTQKDLVKLRLVQMGDRPLWALRIGLHVEVGQEMLERKLEDAISGVRLTRA
jgi:tetraacyldisaccharide 4'-kinase